jgi:hypothetical protein
MASLGHASHELSPEQTIALAGWAASSVADVEKRRRLVRKALWLTREIRPKDVSYLEAIRPKLLGLPLGDDDLTWVAARLALDSVFTIESNLDKLPKAEFAWIENLLPHDHVDYAKGALGHFYHPKQALIFLSAELDKVPNDELVAGYVESSDMSWHRDSMLMPSGGRHGDTAFRLATRVQEPERRIELLVRAWTDLHKDSAQAAREILAIPELNPDDRAAVEAQVAPHLAKKP